MLSLNEARRVIRAAENKAIQLGRPVNIAVADAGGNPIVNVRMDGAWLAGAELALNKAYTARVFDIATSGLLEFTRPGGELAGVNLGNDKRIAIAAGGVPLRRNGRIVGAIGVSGCAASEDETIALAGVRAFAEECADTGAKYPQGLEFERRSQSLSQIARLGNRSVIERQHYCHQSVQ